MIINFILVVAFTTGLFVLGFEMVVSQLVSPLIGDSSLVWASVISITLMYIALGSIIGGIMVDKYGDAFKIYACIPFVCALISTIVVIPSFDIFMTIIDQGVLPSFLIKTMAFISIFVFSLPILLASTLLPIITSIMTCVNQNKGLAIGRIYAINTIGSIFGALFSAFLLLPYFGAAGSVYAFAIILILIGLIMLCINKKEATLKIITKTP